MRRAGPGDVWALVRLRSEMFDAMGTEQVDRTWQEHARHWFAARLDDPACCLVVVEVNGSVVACAVGAVREAIPSPAVPYGRDVLVSNVCTAAGSRGRGYGRAAFEAVMVWARGTGVGRAELTATEPGRRIYERAGFHDTTSPAMRAMLQ